MDDDDEDDVVIVPEPHPPPPPKISNRSDRSDKPSSSGNVISWSIEETNKERIKLGLRPLDAAQNAVPATGASQERKETFGGVDMGEFVHKPAGNDRFFRIQYFPFSHFIVPFTFQSTPGRSRLSKNSKRKWPYVKNDETSKIGY